MRTEDTQTVKTLLGQLKLTSIEQLWEMTTPADATGVAQAQAQLASAAVMALVRVQDTERRTAGLLKRVTDEAAAEAARVAENRAHNGEWLVQAAREYDREVKEMQQAIMRYSAAVHPLALLLGVASE